MPGQLRKVLLVILDGLRPDAITPSTMPVLHDLTRLGWYASDARTVRPSITVSALTSLASGVGPARHGLTMPRIGALPRLAGLNPLPVALRRAGVETSVITQELTGAGRWIAGALLRLGGVTRVIGTPADPALAAEAALDRVQGNPAREMVVLYLNDTDVAGHAHGWMSREYLDRAARIDAGLTGLAPLVEDPEVMAVVLADHGGGGVDPRDHDLPHPVNDAIPVLLLGGRIPAAEAVFPVSLLDVPPTVLHGFGTAAPPDYEGRVLHEAFVTELVWA